MSFDNAFNCLVSADETVFDVRLNVKKIERSGSVIDSISMLT
jgi:hypothetical protein